MRLPAEIETHEPDRTFLPRLGAGILDDLLVLTMSSSRNRRAIQDFLAGTVVMRLRRRLG
jgi:hypothetical protein